jgi:hypothetical protein
VAGFQVSDGTVSGYGVGGHDLVAHALDGVEQGQLRAGVRAFAAHDEPGAAWVAGQHAGGQQAGDLADLGAVAWLAVGVDGGIQSVAESDRMRFSVP